MSLFVYWIHTKKFELTFDLNCIFQITETISLQLQFSSPNGKCLIYLFVYRSKYTVRELKPCLFLQINSLDIGMLKCFVLHDLNSKDTERLFIGWDDKTLFIGLPQQFQN